MASFARPAQQERSRETRQKILTAALEGLAQYGYAQLSTKLVAELAGVSKGGLFQRFPNKSILIAEAINHYLEILLPQTQLSTKQLQAPLNKRVDAFLKRSWKVINTPEYLGCHEAWCAARNDEDLKALLLPVMAQMEELLSVQPWFPDYPDQKSLNAISSVVMSCLENMALAAIAVGDRYDAKPQLRYLSQLMQRELS